jgi:hypothetical protein
MLRSEKGHQELFLEIVQNDWASLPIAMGIIMNALPRPERMPRNYQGNTGEVSSQALR